MLVTALSPHIGYEQGGARSPSARIARASRCARRRSASGYVTAEQFDAWVRPEDMTHPAG